MIPERQVSAYYGPAVAAAKRRAETSGHRPVIYLSPEDAVRDGRPIRGLGGFPVRCRPTLEAGTALIVVDRVIPFQYERVNLRPYGVERPA